MILGRIAPALACLIAGVANAFGIEQELVVKDVFSPLDNNSRFERAWGDAFPLGDIDRDGKFDSMFLCSVRQSIPGAPSNVPALFSPGAPSFEKGPNGGPSDRITYFGSRPRVYTTLLASNNGTHLVASDGANPGRLSRWNIQSGQHELIYSLPQPPLGFPQIGPYHRIQWMGDVTLDGFDDFFCLAPDSVSQSWGVAALICGQTGDAIWQHYEPDYAAIAPVVFTGPGEPFDINGDGYADVLAGFQVWTFFWNRDHKILALSGKDGSVLWESSLETNGADRFVSVGRDLNGDDVPDIISADTPYQSFQGHVAAIDGANGTLLWDFDGALVSPDYPPGTLYGLSSPFLFLDKDGFPGQTQVLVSSSYSPPLAPSGIAYASFDGTTGQYSGLIWPPDNLEPWLPDPMHDQILRTYNYVLGDIDGDGRQEVAHSVPTPAYQTWGQFVPRALVVLGQKTLNVRPDCPVGSRLSFEISMPALANHSYRVLLSNRFGRHPFSWKIQGWDTGLIDSLLLNYSIHASQLSGNLDPLGLGACSIQIPNSQKLVGLSIWSKAVVYDSAGIDVETLSTLGRTTLM